MLASFPSELPAAPSSAPASVVTCAPSPETDTGGAPSGAFADFLDAVATPAAPVATDSAQPSATPPALPPAPGLPQPVPRQSLPVLLWQFAEQLQPQSPATNESTALDTSVEGETPDMVDFACDVSETDEEEPSATVDPQWAGVIPFPTQPESPAIPLGMPGFVPAQPAVKTDDSTSEENMVALPGVAFRFTRSTPARAVETPAPAQSAPAPTVPADVRSAPEIATTVPAPAPVAKGRGAPAAEPKEAPGFTPPPIAATPVSAAPAQISSSASPRFAGEGNDPGSKNKKRSQDADSKVDASTSSSAGTARAYEQASMSSSSATFVAPAAVARPSEATSAPAPAAAVRLVERVAEVAENLSANPSEPMSLSIQLDDTHRVDVRVTMRDGQVHAAFRSDSPEVRAALSSAWEGFVRSRDGAEQRWAEPVFAPINSSTPAAPSLLAATPVSEARSEAGLAGSGQEQQQRQQQAPEPRTEVFPGVRSRAAAFAAPVSPSAQPAAVRPDSSRHLSAVA